MTPTRSSLVLSALLALPMIGIGSPGSAAGPETLLRIDRSLEEIDARVSALEGLEHSSRAAVAKAKQDLRLASVNLEGSHWTEAGPRLERIRSLEGRADELSVSMDTSTASASTGELIMAAEETAATGGITGRVLSAESGEPVSTAEVFAFDEWGYAVAWSYGTGADGTYEVTGLPAGSYFVKAMDGGYDRVHADELWYELSCAPGCDPTTGTAVSVAAGETTPGIDFSLDRLASLSGTVSVAGGVEPLSQVQVYLYDDLGFYLTSRETGSLGTYSIPGLESGTYYALVDPPFPYLRELYGGIHCGDHLCEPSIGDPIYVSGGEEATGYDFELDRGATIEYLLVDSLTGEDLGGSFLQVYDETGVPLSFLYGHSDGVYKIGPFAGGTYFLVASAPGYRTEVYDSTPCVDPCDPTSGVPLVLEAGETFTLHWGLEKLGTISGIVYDESGYPIPYVPVVVHDGVQDFGYVWTSEDGTYLVEALPDGSYTVAALPSWGGVAYADEVWDDVACSGACDMTAGDPIPVEVGISVEGVDFVLAGASRLELTVTFLGDPPHHGFEVTLYDATGAETRIVPGYGDFVEILGLSPGSYFLKVAAVSFLTEVYPDLPCAGDACDPTQGEPIEIRAGETTALTMDLMRLTTVVGSVQDGHGVGIVGATVELFDGVGSLVATTMTEWGFVSGGFSFQGFFEGAYSLRISKPGYQTLVYPRAPCLGKRCPASGSLILELGETRYVNLVMREVPARR